MQFIIIPLIIKNETIENSIFIMSSIIYLLYVLIKNIKYEVLFLGFIYYATLMLIYIVPCANGIGYYYSLAHDYTYDASWGVYQKLVIIFIQFLILHFGIFLKKIVIEVYHIVRKQEVSNTSKSQYNELKIVTGFFVFLHIIMYLLMPVIYPVIFGGRLEGFETFILAVIIATLIAYKIKGVDPIAWRIGLIISFILSPMTFTFDTYEFGTINPPFLGLVDSYRVKIILLNIYGYITAYTTLFAIRIFNKINKNKGENPKWKGR